MEARSIFRASSLLISISGLILGIFGMDIFNPSYGRVN
jgi:hypothetical protein